MNANPTTTKGTQSAPGPRQYLTSAQAGERLGFAEATLRNWRSAGEGPPYRKIGHTVRYVTEELDAWADRLTVVPKYGTLVQA